MNAASERSKPLWLGLTELEHAPKLESDESADVVIIGAGIAGLSAAYELTSEGRSVVVLDRGAVLGGMTARTSAHLSSACDDFYDEMISVHGLEAAKQWFASQAGAVSRIEHIQGAEQIACDFQRVNGFLFSPHDQSILEREFEAAHQVGLATTWIERAPIPGIESGRALCYPGQARFHPLKYGQGLARVIRDRGGRIYAGTTAESVEEKDGVTVSTRNGPKVSARAAIVATNSPINSRVAIHTKQAPYRTYVIAGHIPSGSVTDALYWDTLDPYHYVRLQPHADGDYLIVGGEDHKSGEAEDMQARLSRLEAWARRHFPQLQTVEYRWSGQIFEPVDGFAFIGRDPHNENVYLATGDSGQGITQGVVAGMLLRDLVLGRKNPWTDVYEPGRKPLKSVREFISENVTMAVNLTEYVTGGDVTSVDDLRPGQGALVRSGTRKIAAYRDESGTLHARSAVCTHMGCIVQWNPFERCWDCPCHGSQFSIDGEVLNGPAIGPLAAAELREKAKT